MRDRVADCAGNCYSDWEELDDFDEVKNLEGVKDVGNGEFEPVANLIHLIFIIRAPSKLYPLSMLIVLLSFILL